ncbi:MAG: cobalamin-dependent protein [Deltaproteobacteria bacterium]|nr:cobalamin-dependent protein [Deltaproteobacteria bacterium]
MRILLVNPPYPVCESLTMPLGLLYLAARLEKAGHEVFLEDAQLCRSPLRRLKRTLQRLDPQVVGITSFSINLAMASRMLQMVKRLCPGAVTVWGGPHVSFADEDILRHHTWVDVIVRGEGEETLVELMEKVRESSRRGICSNSPSIELSGMERASLPPGAALTGVSSAWAAR